MSPQETTIDFFVSYTRADFLWAEWIAAQLTDSGYSVFFAPWALRAGNNFVLGMEEALQRSSHVLAVLSPEYMSSRYGQPEWASAFATDPDGAARRLIPVRVADFEPGGLLQPLVYVDLVGQGEEGARRALLSQVEKWTPSLRQAAAFPGPTARRSSMHLRLPTAAGDLVWGIPPSQQRNPNFTGRQALLEELRGTLIARRQQGLPLVLTGMPGVGKTDVAVEYANQFRNAYRFVLWARADDPSSLDADFERVAAKLGLGTEPTATPRQIVERVHERLQRESDWLFVFDNADDFAGLREYLPVADRGHILVTSTNPNWRAVATTREVKVFPRDESVQYLLQRTGRKDRGGAADLAHAVQDFPLALAHAAAYMEETGTTIQAYLKLFRKYEAQLLDQPGPVRGVVATFKVAFEKLAKKEPAAAEVLNLCAFLAPADIPEALFTAAAPALPPHLSALQEDELAWRAALKAIRTVSLADVEDGSIAVHRLVQKALILSLSEGARKEFAERAAGLVEAALPEDCDDHRSWPTCARLLPHASTVVEHCEKLAVALGACVEILNSGGIYLRSRGQYRPAFELLERALGHAKTAHGPESAEVADVLNNVAGALVYLARAEEVAGSREAALVRLDEAQRVIEDAMRIHERLFPPDSPEILADVSMLAAVFRGAGKLDEALAQFERVLAVDEKLYGPAHSEVGIDLENIGTLLRRLKRLDEAEAAFERALGIEEQSADPNPRVIGRRLNNLALVLRDRGDPGRAHLLLGRAFRIFQENLGDDHPDTRLTFRNMQSLEPPTDLAGTAPGPSGDARGA